MTLSYILILYIIVYRWSPSSGRENHFKIPKLQGLMIKWTFHDGLFFISCILLSARWNVERVWLRQGPKPKKAPSCGRSMGHRHWKSVTFVEPATGMYIFPPCFDDKNDFIWFPYKKKTLDSQGSLTYQRDAKGKILMSIVKSTFVWLLKPPCFWANYDDITVTSL